MSAGSAPLEITTEATVIKSIFEDDDQKYLCISLQIPQWPVGDSSHDQLQARMPFHPDSHSDPRPLAENQHYKITGSLLYKHPLKGPSQTHVVIDSYEKIESADQAPEFTLTGWVRKWDEEKVELFWMVYDEFDGKQYSQIATVRWDGEKAGLKEGKVIRVTGNLVDGEPDSLRANGLFM